ncbi:hypothetical protein, conserved [Babesia ovata]|uniref:Uncharacterized protein n=1 Tax=Babesia ovata TaxID=189622 RepID=A0A2H6K8W6_9APIC|nr:uncharacterized protein BOVATA_009110 [Babesia ovata]GBE59418.1 hypothetical protein, conserved [Babesia ovata]
MDRADRLQLDLEVHNTYAMGNGRFGQINAETMLPSSHMPGHRDLPLHVRFNTAELQEAVSSNINNTLNNNIFSIYGGINGIWDKKSSAANSWEADPKEFANRSTTFEDVFRRSFYEDYQNLLSANQNFNNYTDFPSLASTNSTALSERMIEDTLKMAFDMQPQDNALKNGQEQLIRSGFKGQRRSQSSSGKSRKGSKQRNRDEVKEQEVNGRKETKVQEKKHPNAWKSSRNVGSTLLGEEPTVHSEFAEAGSINNILEASEIWLRHTTGSSIYNKKSILKKHFPSEEQFYLGVS